jgi:hypothetical protein
MAGRVEEKSESVQTSRSERTRGEALAQRHPLINIWELLPAAAIAIALRFWGEDLGASGAVRAAGAVSR